ncbi:MAG: D-arabinose 5-phosphate isomerase [Gammaproteobacteria bacterium]|nr:D-arabinose 5-phosphate isomerase [Gammaproteobacteria bacterium]
MKKIDKIAFARTIIRSEASELNNVARKLNKNFDGACNEILSCSGKVITVGLGKSGHVASKAAATLSSTGTPSIFLHGAEALHGDMGLVNKSDIIVFFSNSGETKELLLLLPLFKILKVKLIAIVGDRKSTLAKSVDYMLDSSVTKEACPLDLTPTSSVISAIGIADAMALTLLKCRGFTSKDFAKSHPQGELGKRLLKRCADIMYKSKLPIVYEDMKLIKAIDVITKYNKGLVIVLNKNKKLLGLYTDGDLRRTLKKSSDISEIKLFSVMTKKPITINQNILAAEGLTLMETAEISSLVVEDDKRKVIGLLTLNQLLKSGIQ